jgi:predicted dehydrogenase
MKKKLGVLIHGGGWVSSQHLQAFVNNPGAEIVAVSSRTREGARRCADQAGLDVPCLDDFAAALRRPEVDIVAIGTPQHLHAGEGIAAAGAGKHILIEKPAAQTLPELRAMIDAVRAAGVKTVVSFVLRWNPLFMKLKRMSAEGAFGEIFAVETDYLSYCGDWWGGYPRGRTRTMGGSAFLLAGCHALDALRWFAGKGEFEAADPVEIFAYAGGRRGASTRQYNPVTNDWHDGALPLEYPGLEMAMVRFANGVLGRVSVNFECIQPYAFPVTIFGDRGTVKDHRVWSHAYPDQKEWIELPDTRPDSADVRHHPFQAEIDHLVACIEEDRESHCNLLDAVKTHELVFAAQECYRTRAPVTLPL